MTITARSVELVEPNGSHWFSRDHRGLSKEELYPVLNIDVPRLGMVKVEFEASRYVFYDGDWSDWRIMVRKCDPSYGTGGYGSATHKAISGAGEPVIRKYLASPAYRASRQEAMAHLVRRAIIDATLADYGIRDMRKALEAHKAELTKADATRFARAIEHLAKATALLDKESV